MGKPKAKNIRRKQKQSNQSRLKMIEDSTVQPMEDISDSVEIGLEERGKKLMTKVVTEDIKINQGQKSKVLKKKDKRKLKRNKLIGKLQSTETIIKEAQKAKERSKAVIIGDMKPLMDALPEIKSKQQGLENISTNLTSNQPTKKSWSSKKWKTRRKEELQDIELFRKVLQLPEYKNDPICAISSHVEYMVKGDLI